jgi:hypothetical protein
MHSVLSKQKSSVQAPLLQGGPDVLPMDLPEPLVDSLKRDEPEFERQGSISKRQRSMTPQQLLQDDPPLQVPPLVTPSAPLAFPQSPLFGMGAPPPLLSLPSLSSDLGVPPSLISPQVDPSALPQALPQVDPSVNPFAVQPQAPAKKALTKDKRRKSTKLRRPRRETEKLNKEFAEGAVEQPIRKLSSAPAPKQVFPPDLATRVSGVADLKPSQPLKAEVESMGRIKGMDAVLDRFDLSGGKQGGKYPAKHLHESPEVADYTQARPLQMLSDFSDILLAAAEAEGQNPVEIQLGYGLRDGSVDPDMFASANNKASEDWLLGAMADPMKYVKAAAGGEDENLKAIASKLLFYDEQVAQRKQQVIDSDLPNQEEVLAEIDLATKIREKVLGGRTDIAYNPLGGKTGARHAEQNIADVLHQKGYAQGEIGGTKIRCEACTSELGPAMLDEHDRFSMGKFYGAQASKPRHEDTWGLLSSGKAKVSQNQVSRPRSNSLVAAFQKKGD